MQRIPYTPLNKNIIPIQPIHLIKLGKKQNSTHPDPELAAKLLAKSKPLVTGGMNLSLILGRYVPVVTILKLKEANIHGWTLQKESNEYFLEYFENGSDCPFCELKLTNDSPFFLAGVTDSCCEATTNPSVIIGVIDYVLSHMP
ncbi:MAG: hypothetical protein ACKUBY_03715 [Candidatus Moraniibacteriota bacterium]|jgi:hypothetical protein